MSEKIITVEGLGKRYLVGHQHAPREKYTAFRDVLARNARDLVRKTRDIFAGRQIVQGDAVEEFWALKDISFEVKRGEVLGIIGRNGAGKSTLLKILSRITEPSKGRIEIDGRVASLLEVGTGFHPELTGRENIFLNGAIMGMSRAEIRAKFDEIVAFAEVERFLDTPVKRYSSGMYVRLAFAVAAHLEPEILIVDEVLAVGDAQFQKKCFGKVNEASKKEGRSVLFVSHNMQAVQSLCSSAIVLRSGLVETAGSASHCIAAYLDDYTRNNRGADIDLSREGFQRRGDRKAVITRLRLLDANQTPSEAFPVGAAFCVELTVDVADRLADFVLGFDVSTKEQIVVFCSNHYDSLKRQALPVGRHVFRCFVKGVFLSPGRYSMTVAINSGDLKVSHDFVTDAAELNIQEVVSDDHGGLDYLIDGRPGFIRTPLQWEMARA